MWLSVAGLQAEGKQYWYTVVCGMQLKEAWRDLHMNDRTVIWASWSELYDSHKCGARRQKHSSTRLQASLGSCVMQSRIIITAGTSMVKKGPSEMAAAVLQIFNQRMVLAQSGQRTN